LESVNVAGVLVETYARSPGSLSFLGADVGETTVMLSPVGLVFFTELAPGSSPSLGMFLGPAVFYLVLLVWLRRRCLVLADSYLGRLPEPKQTAGGKT